MIFDLQKHIASKMPAAQKMFDALQKKGVVTFLHSDNNTRFSNGKKELVISNKLLFRISGIACLFKDGEERNSSVAIDVTDDMFYGSYLKSIIEFHFN